MPWQIGNLLVDGDGMQIRDRIHVRDHCRGISAVLCDGRGGKIYNFGGHSEWQNIDVNAY